MRTKPCILAAGLAVGLGINSGVLAEPAWFETAQGAQANAAAGQDMGDILVTGIIEATGNGAADIAGGKSPVQARLMAKRAAMVDAQRLLTETINGIRLTGGTTMENYQVVNDTVATRVKGLLRGAFVMDEKIEAFEDSFMATVRLGVCISGQTAQCYNKATLSSVLQSTISHSPPENRYKPRDSHNIKAADTAYSGLVIDASDAALIPSLDARLKTRDGRELYGPSHFSGGKGEWLHWARNVEKAQQMKAVVGEKPLVVKAASVNDDYEVIVNDDDAVKIFSANLGSDDFLGQGKVVVVVK